MVNSAIVSSGTLIINKLADVQGSLTLLDHKSGLEIENDSKSPFGDFQRKNGHQVKKCSCQVVQ